MPAAFSRSSPDISSGLTGATRKIRTNAPSLVTTSPVRSTASTPSSSPASRSSPRLLRTASIMRCSTARRDRAQQDGRRRGLARRDRAAARIRSPGPRRARKRPSARRQRSAARTIAHRSNSVCEATNPATTGSPPTYTPVTAAPMPWIGESQFAHANPTRIPPIIAAICPTVKSQPNRSFASRCAGAGFTRRSRRWAAADPAERATACRRCSPHPLQRPAV